MSGLSTYVFLRVGMRVFSGGGPGSHPVACRPPGLQAPDSPWIPAPGWGLLRRFPRRFVLRRPERSSEHPSQGLPPMVVEFFQTQVDGSGILPEAEGTEEHVPPGKDRPVVGVGLRLPTTVVDTVHCRGDDDRQKPMVQPARYLEVGMVKENYREEKGLVNRQVPEGDSQDGENGESGDRGKKHLPGVEPKARRDVHRRITMVHPVEPPEEGDPMICPMPGIHPEVEEENCQSERQPPWKLQDPEEPYALLLGPDLHHNENCAEKNGYEKSIPGPQHQVSDVVPRFLTHASGKLRVERENPFRYPQED